MSHERHCDVARFAIINALMIERLLAFTEHRLTGHHSAVSHSLAPHDYVVRAVARVRERQDWPHHPTADDAFAHLCLVIESLIDEAEMNEKRRNLRVV